MNEQELYDKWEHRIGKGWYGFDIGGVPADWIKQIDEYLAWLEKNCPDFEIHQIKIKFGSLRVYVDLGLEKGSIISKEILKEVNSREAKLEQLYLKKLFY